MIAEYYYDPFGRRLWKEVGGVRTYFCYADEGLIGEYDSTGAEIKTYGYKPGSTWTTDPLFMKEGASYYFYHTDHLGTPQKMTAVNGAVVWSAKYSSFGEANVDAASTITNPLRFPGQYEDTETGLHYNWHRYYETANGRYLRSDPLGINNIINDDYIINMLFKKFKDDQFSSFDNVALNSLYNSYESRFLIVLLKNPLMLNRYIYANCNPQQYFDSTGLISMCMATCNAFWGNLICTPVTIIMSVLGTATGVGLVPGILLSAMYNILCRATVAVACYAHCEDPCAKEPPKGHPFY